MRMIGFLVVAAAAVVLSGCGKTLYDFGAEQLRKNPALRAEATKDCERDIARKSLFERKLLADAMKASLSRTPRMFCRRIVQAVASGRLTNADLNDSTSDKVIRVIEGK